MATPTQIRRRGRFGLVLGTLVATVLFAAVAYADIVAPDADVVTTGDQTTVDLGNVAPGAVIVRATSFKLVCDGKNHVDGGQTLSLTYASAQSSIPSGGSLAATNASIGPVPASWADDTTGGGSTNCPDTDVDALGLQPPTLSDNGDSSVTITAPTAAGPYSYTVRWNHGLSPAGSGDPNAVTSNHTTVTYTLTVVSTDTTAPGDPSISINDGAPWTNSTSATVDISATDAVGVASYRLAPTQAGLGSATPIAVSPAATTFSASDLSLALSSGDGTKSAWVRFCDAANNCSDASDTIGLDTAKPVITGSTGTYVPGSWTNQSVTVSFACADNVGGSGIATNTVAGTTVTNSGANQSVTNTGTCVDNAGNVADSATVSDIDIDKDAPTIADAGVQSGTLGSNGWYISAVVNRFTASDALSGLGAACSVAFPKDVSTGTSEGSSVSVSSGSCTDNAGNTNSGISSAAFKIDLTNPSVAIISPATGLTTIAANITVSGTASDAPSGVASVTVNGNAATGTTSWSKTGVALTCGSNTITATATDVAGRTNSDSISVTRLCFGLQYLYPLDQSTSSAVLNVGKYGRVIPVKVLLSLAGGGTLDQDALTNLGLTLQIGVNAAWCSTGTASDSVEAYADAGQSSAGTNLFRWDAAALQWIYNLDTKAPPAVSMTINSCYLLDVYVSDGTNKVKISGGSNPYALFKPVK